ncbi:MAG: SMC family ATPase, partial [Cyanobacteria bacterium P01_E01_bin.43]
MQILSVTLKNFKTHRDRQFTFAPGTNAICGENGAGKTSILEAIAWVLFNYLGDYVKDDLIRNGSGSAEVTVEFISNQDDRTYTVQRHTSKGYTLFDPQLNQRLPYTRIKDEVLPWLREHLGVAPGTDLGELFARTVGVPQGTFTADFLQTAENRKTVFDKVLKVEEYKTVYKELNSLRRYAEAKAEAVTSEIARFEERLATWDELQTRQQAIATEITHNEGQLAAFDQQLQTLTQERDALQAQATQIQQLQTQQQ